MKKILSLILMSALALGGLSACQNQSTGSDSSQGEAKTDTAQTTLVVAARGGSHVDAINAVKESFEKENNCNIEILGLEAGDLKQKIALDSKNAEGAYDLIMADDPWIPEFTEADIFLNLTKAGIADDSDFIPASLKIGKAPYGTGDTFALPFAGNVQLFFYNKDLLAKQNLDVPTDWQAVLDFAQKTKADGALGYVIRGQQGNPIVSDYLPLLWAFGGDVFDEDWNITVDSKAGVDALNMYIELLKTGENYEKNDLVNSVAQGSAAMALGWPSWFISGGDAKAAYAAIPGKASADGQTFATGMIGHWMMGVPKNSTHRDLALKFLQFITGSDTQKEMALHGGVPTRASVYEDQNLSAKFPFYSVLKDATANSVARPRTPKWGEIETVYGAELSAAISGSKTVDAALKDAKVAIEAVMK